MPKKTAEEKAAQKAAFQAAWHLSMTLTSSLRAVVDLRVAWLHGDPFHRAHVVMALKAVLASKLLQDNREKALACLKQDLDVEQSTALLNALWPMPWSKD